MNAIDIVMTQSSPDENGMREAYVSIEVAEKFIRSSRGKHIFISGTQFAPNVDGEKDHLGKRKGEKVYGNAEVTKSAALRYLENTYTKYLRATCVICLTVGKQCIFVGDGI